MKVSITLFIGFLNCFLCLSEGLSIPQCKIEVSDKIIQNEQYKCSIKITAPNGWKFPKAPNVIVENAEDFLDVKKELLHSDENEYSFSISAGRNKSTKMDLNVKSPICSKFCVLANDSVAINFGEKNPLLIYIILGFLGGLILNIMPCVLPVLLMKLKAFKSKIGLMGSICGNFATFLLVIVGLIGVKSTGAFVGWGMHFQNTSFLIVTAIILFVLVLYSFGFFQFTPSITVKNSAKSVFWKNFISSVVATFVAIPCTAPFLGVAATFAIQGTMLQLICVFLAIAIGFSFPYIFVLFVPVKMPNISGKIANILDKIIGYGVLVTFLWVLWLLFQNITAPKTNFEHTYKNIQTDISNNHMVIMNITADWCLTCKYNNRYILNSKEVKQAISKNNAKFIEIDITKEDNAVTQFLHKHGRVGIPFTIIYGPSARKGIVLDETPSVKQVVQALEKAK